jgi:trk system potassium uptake protein TrkH
LNYPFISRISGVLAIIFALSLCVPLVIAVWFQEPELSHLLIPMVGTLLLGLLLLGSGYRAGERVSHRDGFLIVAVFWALLSLLGTWPLLLCLDIPMLDALFESVSAITTTGATILTGLDEFPKSILFYRQQMQWLGGMGLIVLGIAVLPMLGIGGMQLYKAEAPGPMKEEKFTPRLVDTAKALWVIYMGLTASCAIGYWLAGMTLFDAIAHSLSTVSTGGFSTHDESLGFYRNMAIESVAILFMILAAINFGVHYVALYQGRLRQYLVDIEVRSYLVFVIGMVLLVGLTLRLEGNYEQIPPSLRDATFEVVSVVTSTGFGTVDFSHWPDFLPVLLIFISFIGGCGGSTAGGIKMMRVLLLLKQGYHEVRRLIRPNALLTVRLGTRVIETPLMHRIWGFFVVYVVTFAVLMLMMMHSGLDQVSAFSAVATCLNNLGPGLGEVAYNFQSVSPFGKIIAIVAMLLGRLEIFTILVLLSPEFWRR